MNDGPDDDDDLDAIAARVAAIAKANGSAGTGGATVINLADAKAEIARLAQVDKISYERERADAARRLGMRVSALDDFIKKERRPDTPAANDGKSALSLEELEAWPLRVDGAPLADEIRSRLLAHVVFARAADADVATLWTIGTYLMDTWRLWPKLTITSPTRQCGKTTLLEVLEAVVMRGLPISNATVASVFRAIEGWRPTLLCDEADTWMKDDKELSGILNSGHTRRTARVIRTEENKSGERVPTLFSTWAAMAIAGIGSQRDTLMSRSIVIGLARKLPGESVERMPHDLHDGMFRVRRQILRWTDDNKVRIGAMDVEPPACGDDRKQDNYTPIWRVALALGGPWPDRIASAYVAGSPAGTDAEEPTNVLLLGDVHDIFVRQGASRISTSDLLQALLSMLDRPWLEMSYGRPLNQYGLARMLKSFDVQPRAREGHLQRVPVGRRGGGVRTLLPSYPPSSDRNTGTSQRNQWLSWRPMWNTKWNTGRNTKRNTGRSTGDCSAFSTFCSDRCSTLCSTLLAG